MDFTASRLAANLGGTLWGDDAGISGLAIDSRILQPGQLFAAVEGDRDGHDFVSAARQAEAGAVLVNRVLDDGPSIVVPDVSMALTRMAGLARRRLPEFVVGVTGSVGKTTTKDLLAAVLTERFRTAASPESFNNELGVPLTLANAPDDTEAVVVEMGARGHGHISHLCSMALPTIGVVTTVEAVHTEYLGSMEQVALAKRELPECLPPDGLAVLNADNPLVAAMAEHTRAATVFFGGSSRANVRATGIEFDADLRGRFRLESEWGSAEVEMGARGAHNVSNALAAAAVALASGVSVEAVAAGLSSPIGSKWRMELLRTPDGVVVLNDSYNAGPASMKAAMLSLAELAPPRRIAVLGTMAELGDRAAEEHRQVADLAKAHGIEVIAVGTDLYARPADAADADEAAELLLQRLGESDADTAVLIKGSRVAGLEAIADALGAR